MHFLYRLAISRKIWADTRGQDMIEYALLLMATVVGIVALIPDLTPAFSQHFSKIKNWLDKAAG